MQQRAIPHHGLAAEEVGRVLVLRFRQRSLLEEETLRDVHLELTRLPTRGGRTRLLLDFAAVEHLSSVFVTTLMKLRELVRAAGGRLALCGLRPNVAELFRLTGADRAFAIYADELEALASF